MVTCMLTSQMNFANHVYELLVWYVVLGIGCHFNYVSSYAAVI